MKSALLLGVLAIVCACQGAPPKSAITKVAAGGAANLLTLPAGEGFSLSSRNYGAFSLRGRCLVLRYDNRDFTPVFKETPYPVRVTGTELTVYAMTFRMGVDLLLSGLVPSAARADIPAECPQSLAIVPSIQTTDG